MATKPNPPTPKNQLNLADWVRSILVEQQIDCTPLVKTWKLYILSDRSKRTRLAITSDKKKNYKKLLK